MKKALTCLCVAVTIAGGSSVAFAAEDGWYALGAVGQTTSDNNKATLDSIVTAAGGVGYTSSYSKHTFYKLQAGYQINKNFAAEGGYLGSTNSTYSAAGGNLGAGLSASGSISGWNLTAVGILPVSNQFSLLGKLGVADIRTSATVSGGGLVVGASGSKSDLTYGIGAKYDFTNAIFARFDIDSYKAGAAGSYSRNNVWALGVGYKF